MSAPRTPLRRDLPLLRQDGTIKFRAVLRFARGRRAFRREDDARCRPYGIGGSCLIHRIDRVRDDMSAVRERIADERAFWSVANRPTQVLEGVTVEAWGHAWTEYRPAPVAVETREAA